MGLFSFTQEIAMDLGTANTILLSNDKIVVDEPSVVALDRRTDKMIAVGERAKLMYEKENPNIRTVRPLRDGVIADFNACEQMMRGLIKKVNTGRRLFTPSLRMVIGVPSGSNVAAAILWEYLLSIVRCMEPLCTMAFWKRPFAEGVASSVDTFPPPPDCPNMVTFDGSPPKFSIFSFTQRSAATKSSKPTFTLWAYLPP